MHATLRPVASATCRIVTRSASRQAVCARFCRHSFLPQGQRLGRFMGCGFFSKSAHQTPYAMPHSVGVQPGDGDKRPPGLVDDAWNQLQQTQKYPSLKEDIEVDVCIIGAGIYGLSIGYQLIKSGKSVAILEAKTRGSGQTGKTTAHIMQWNDDFYSEIKSKFGTKNTMLVAQSQTAATDFIENIVKEEKIDCNFARVTGYLFPHDDHKSTKKQLDEEYDTCIELGMREVTKVNLNGDPRNGSLHEAVAFPKCGDFDPLMYINGLAEAIVKRGGKIYEMTRVNLQQIETAGGKVGTESGGTVTAKDAIVYATHSPLHHNLAIHAKQSPYRTYAVGLELKKGSVDRAQWWDTAEPYHYVRTYTDRKGRDILIVGGGDHPTGQRPDKYRDMWEELADWARQRWTSAGEIVYKWTGMVFEPIDQLGIYGEDPINPVNAVGQVKRYVATGDSGQGMTGSAIAAMVISDQICGKANPWSDVYSPSRLLTAAESVPEVAEVAFHVGKGYAEVAAPRDLRDIKGLFVSSMDDVKPGTGAVLQEGLQKVACFRQDDGKLLKYSAICPHMGCLVEYNPNDRTFDCPCHGSQFDQYGKMVNGPTTTDLKPLSW